MRIAVYLRFSSERQSASSLEDQLRLCRTLAQRNGWTVVAVYRDAALSGALRDRKGYRASSPTRSRVGSISSSRRAWID